MYSILVKNETNSLTTVRTLVTLLATLLNGTSGKVKETESVKVEIKIYVQGVVDLFNVLTVIDRQKTDRMDGQMHK